MSWWTGKPAKDAPAGSHVAARRGDGSTFQGKRDPSADSRLYGSAIRESDGRASYVDPNRTIAVQRKR